MGRLAPLNAKGRTIIMVTHSEENARHDGRIPRLVDSGFLRF
jgi:putative ABC transport system ATP-binding protein